MARGDGPRGPAGVDLAAYKGDDPRDRPEGPQEQPLSYYVNDVQPSLQNDGTLSLTFAYQGSAGTSPGVSVTMPVGLFLELATLAPRLTKDAVERMEANTQRLAGFLAGGAQRAAAAQTEAERRGGPPTPIRGE